MYQSKSDIEHQLLEITALLHDEKKLSVSDRFTGPGKTCEMWLNKQAALSAQYIDMVTSETSLKQTRFIPTWQDSYDLL
jgi:hypothetical protein